MKLKRRTVTAIIFMLFAAVLVLAQRLFAYPIESHLAILPQYISEWYSHGQSVEVPHEITLYARQGEDITALYNLSGGGIQ